MIRKGEVTDGLESVPTRACVRFMGSGNRLAPIDESDGHRLEHPLLREIHAERVEIFRKSSDRSSF